MNRFMCSVIAGGVVAVSAAVPAGAAAAPLPESARAAVAAQAAAVPAAARTPAAAPRPLTGAATYLRSGDAAFEVLRHRPGRPWQTTSIAGAYANHQLTVSPDGAKAAWVGAGKLHVLTGLGSARPKDRVVASDAAEAPCLTPVFSPDSTTVAYPRRAKQEASVVVAVAADGTGSRVLGKTRGVCHLAWSGAGRYLAGYAGTTEGVYLLDTRTGTSRRAKGIALANHVQSLSPDGRRVVVHRIGPKDPGGDGVWPSWFTPAIVDTRTGDRVAIPVRGSLLGALYLRDGRLVVRVRGAKHNTLVIVGANGRILQRMSEPARVREDALMAVTG
ncbi:hypothetical protein [Microbispora sp. NPDC049125]|uniref:hypothetical protein n=1 Tax=Microbispora sp. NPDC049125 TaxID=3154929 RepID=UPI003467515C